MKYGLILADPPWDYRNGGNGRAAAHYPLMRPAEIAALPVADLAADPAVLLLWSTWPQVSAALQVMAAWGFQYVTGFPWVKTASAPVVDLFGDHCIGRPTYGTGSWIRGCSEPLLIGRRGRARPPTGHWLGLISERFQHSRKPSQVYDYAESFPGPYLELFARRRRPGWHAWGNQVDCDVELEAVPNGRTAAEV